MKPCSEKDNIERAVDNDKHTTAMWSEGGKGHYTKLDDMYESFFKRMLPEFSGGTVLEVGPGVGEFARRMLTTYDIPDYTILDLEDNINDSKAYLQGCDLQANYVISQDYESLFNKELALFVSNVCLPEVPRYYRVNLLENVLPKCEYAFVIGGNRFSDYNEWIENVFNDCFDSVIMEETGYCNTFAIVGKKKEA